MIKKNLCIAFAFFYLGIFAQKVSTIPSPNVASLLKYAEVPVNVYNGTTSSEIPLCNIDEGDLKIPISASYYTTGLKVEEEASNIGLGWTLNAGGVIHLVGQDNSVYRKDYIPLSSELNQTEDPYESNFVFNYVRKGCNFMTSTGNTESKQFQVGADSDFLVCIYNFNGYTGKFIEDKDHNFVSIDKNNIKLERIINSANNTTGFKAITTDGLVYFFELKATIDTHSSTDCQTTQHQYRDSYYLTKIVSPQNKIANFTYVSTQVESLPHLIQNYTKEVLASTSNPFNAPWSNSGPPFMPFEGLNFGYSASQGIDYTISEINTNNSKIVFQNSNREDIKNGKKIDKISLYSKSDTEPIKTILFDYDYFTGSPTFGDYTVVSTAMGTCGVMPNNILESYKSKRLKLKAIKFGETNSNDMIYRFVYDATTLPYKTSAAQDLWGFFNGATNSGLIPNVNNLGYKDNNIPFHFVSNPQPNDRSFNEKFLKAGLLKLIIYPTGGHALMDYESNQFGSPTINSTLVETTQSIYDYNSTVEQSKTFTIPSIINQSVKLSITLTCSSTGPCDLGTSTNNLCAPYSNSGLGVNLTVHPNDIRLYGLLEKNVNGNWQIISEYSRNNADLVNYGIAHGVCGVYNVDITNLITPGAQYRMRVNYPDNKTGILGSAWVDMKISYFTEQEILYPNKGAGLRIKNVTYFDTDGKKASEKNYSYKNGILMTKPVFYRVKDRTDSDMFAPINNANCPTVFNMSEILCNDLQTNSSLIPYVYSTRTLMLNSDPTVPYSYNAQGSLVGYSEVTIQYGNKDNSNGEEVYTFNNLSDYSTYYASRPIGLPEIRYLRNGTLKEKSFYKIAGNGPFSTKEIVKKEIYDFIVKDQRRYWAYMAEYIPMNFYCPTTLKSSSVLDYNSNFMHFYPIKTGKILLNSKKEISYFNGKAITRQYNYNYNDKNQLASEKITDDDGKITEIKNYYPNDLLLGNQSSEMQMLINSNRIDIPVKFEKFINNKKVFEKAIKYTQDASTGNILLPKEEHDLLIKDNSQSLDINTLDNIRTIYDRYDSYGNVLQYTNDKKPVVFIWGYNKMLPIAKIEGGATYPNGINSNTSDIPQDLINSIVEASNLDVDAASEAALDNKLDNFRKDVRMKGYLITTYIYDPLIGLKNITYPSGIKEFYFYDNKNRLILIKDNENNIVKNYNYHYINSLASTNIFVNAEISKTFLKNDCPTGQVGTPVTYTIPQGSYISNISQNDADSKAQNNLNSNGQNYANTYGICSQGCPFTLASNIDSTNNISSVMQDGNTISMFIEISTNNQNVNLPWTQGGYIIGTVGENCKPTSTRAVDYTDEYTGIKWKIIVFPVTGQVLAMVLNGQVSINNPIQIKIQYQK